MVDSSLATVSITATPVNDAPVAVADTLAATVYIAVTVATRLWRE